jgi:hypothetical protein
MIPTVVLIVFNRPETTARVFARIREARPARLLVASDAPRPDRVDDVERCAAARAASADIDWPCDVVRDDAVVHLGCKHRVESALDRAFDDSDGAIVLEDDCLPDPTFFPFCIELLERYRDDDRLMTVSGNRLVAADGSGAASYHVSRYHLTWGWGTWRRAWHLYDRDLGAWPALRDAGWLDASLGDRIASQYWAHIFEREWEQAAADRNWDYAWTLSCWRHGGWGLVPAVNLVANVGFGADATHNTDTRSPYASSATTPMTFPLRHPAVVARDEEEDAVIETDAFSGNLALLLSHARQRMRRRR